MSCVTQGLTRETRDVHTVARSCAHAFERRRTRKKAIPARKPDNQCIKKKFLSNLKFLEHGTHFLNWSSKLRKVGRHKNSTRKKKSRFQSGFFRSKNSNVIENCIGLKKIVVKLIIYYNDLSAVFEIARSSTSKRTIVTVWTGNLHYHSHRAGSEPSRTDREKGNRGCPREESEKAKLMSSLHLHRAQRVHRQLLYRLLV